MPDTAKTVIGMIDEACISEQRMLTAEQCATLPENTEAAAWLRILATQAASDVAQQLYESHGDTDAATYDGREHIGLPETRELMRKAEMMSCASLYMDIGGLTSAQSDDLLSRLDDGREPGDDIRETGYFCDGAIYDLTQEVERRQNMSDRELTEERIGSYDGMMEWLADPAINHLPHNWWRKPE